MTTEIIHWIDRCRHIPLEIIRILSPESWRSPKSTNTSKLESRKTSEGPPDLDTKATVVVTEAMNGKNDIGPKT